MDANLQDKKIELIQWLSTLNDMNIINKILKLREKEKADWWNEISTEERASIEKGITDAEAGKLTSQTEVKKLYGKWL